MLSGNDRTTSCAPYNGVCKLSAMVNDLLSRAARSKSPVRVAALLRVARVQTAFDRGQARITFEIALEEVQRLKGRERESMLQLARLIAAAVAPDLLDEIP